MYNKIKLVVVYLSGRCLEDIRCKESLKLSWIYIVFFFCLSTFSPSLLSIRKKNIDYFFIFKLKKTIED